MNKILIQTVGTGGPHNPVWEALAFTMHRVRPDHVLWLCSSKTANDTLPRVRQLCQDLRFTDTQSVCPDPEDVGRLLPEYLRAIEDLRARHPQADFVADFTSGTKAMSGACVAAAMIAGVPDLRYATGPRDESGRVVRTERADPMDAAPLIAARELPELGSLFNRGQFLAVLEGSKRLVSRLNHGHDRDRAQSLQWMAELLEPWSRFDFKAAKESLKRLSRPEKRDVLEKTGWSVPWVDAASQHIAGCILEGEEPEISHAWLVDVLQNAQRCFDTDRFDDCVSRCYRLTEAIGQYVLRRECDIKSTKRGKISDEKIATYLPNQGTRDLGLRDIHSAIAGPIAAKRPLAAALVEFSSRASSSKTPLQARNDSLLAHGFAPIRNHVARNCVQFVAEGVRAVIGDDCDRLCQIATFPKCPWSVSSAATPDLRLG